MPSQHKHPNDLTAPDENASSTSLPPQPPVSLQPAPIRRLPQDVVNRIAAGEVVVRPSAALKELLENSLDATATSITVTARDGGLKLLHVVDNGLGIRLDDLPLLCERFATSKITAFADLSSVATFGFRGEALSAISHVARLSVLSKTHTSPVGYNAHYHDGTLRSAPAPCAAVTGTALTVADLFYNLPTRRAALRSPADEYRALVDVVARYAIRYPHVAFICRRKAATASSASTPAPDVRTEAGVTPLDNIRSAFGAVVAHETMLFDLKVPVASADISVIATTANFSMKKAVFVFFINGRLVDCHPLRRAISAAYAIFLPKAGHPFVYIDLNMPQKNLDVNVHPMKKEVRFLNEAVIIEAIVDEFTKKLKGTETSRTFLAQSILVTSNAPTPPPSKPVSLYRSGVEAVDGAQNDHGHDIADDIPILDAFANDEHDDVDLDAAIRVNDSVQFDKGDEADDSDYIDIAENTRGAPSKRQRQSYISTPTASVKAPSATQELKAYAKDKVRTGSRDPVGLMDRFVTHGLNPTVAADVEVQRRRRPDALPLLTSVETLLEQCRQNGHKGLMQILKEHTFVGITSHQFALIQYSTQLMLADISELVLHLMYQQALVRFADHNLFAVEPAAPVMRVVQAFLDAGGGSGAGMILNAESCATLVVDKGRMLEEYFGIVVSGDCAETVTIHKLPLLLNALIPDMRFLGEFLFHLVVDTDWTDEQECFHNIALTLAEWYGKHWQPLNGGKGTDVGDGRQGGEPDWCAWDDERREWTLHHVLFAAMRSEYYPPKAFFAKQVVREITSTSKLYKVFERC